MIDGARTPDAIPDENVILTMVQTWVIPRSADAATERRFQARLSQVRLGADDMRILRAILHEAHPAVSAATARLQSAASGSSAMAAREQLMTETTRVYGLMLEFLSADGRNKLRQHVADRKSKTIVVRKRGTPR